MMFLGRGSFSGSAFRGGRGGAPPGAGYGRGGSISSSSPTFGRSESFEREPEYSGTPTGPGSGPPPAGQ